MKYIHLKILILTLCMIARTSAWSETVKYTVENANSVSISETALTGSTAAYSSTCSTKSQLTSGKKMTLTLSGFSGHKITGITLSMKSNQSNGAGYLIAKAGSTTLASIGSETNGIAFNDSKWNGEYITNFTNVTLSMTNANYVIQQNENVEITIGATVNSLYCQSFTIIYETASNIPSTEVKPTHKVFFSANGTIIKEEEVEEGKDITFPSEKLEDINGKTFVGWVGTPISGTQASAPTYVTSAVMGHDDITFYAVFATQGKGSAKLNANGLETSTSYQSRILTDDKGNTWNCYTSVNAYYEITYLGLNSVDEHNIASPTFPGDITSISIKAYNGSKVGKKLLFCSNYTKVQPDDGDIGELVISQYENFNTTYNVDIKKSVKQFYIYAPQPLGISEINVTYQGSTYSDYCTTVTLQTLSLNAKGYSTFSYAKTIKLTGAQVYTATLSVDAITCYKVEDNIVPAGTGVLLYGDASADLTIEPATTDKTSLENNDLKASTLADGSIASIPEKGACTLSGDTFKAYTGNTFAANKAYFERPLNHDSSKLLSIVIEDNGTSSLHAPSTISTSRNAYNITGQRVLQTTKGFVIINGKKHFNK